MTTAERYRTAQRFYIENARATGASERTIANYNRRLNLFFDFWRAEQRERGVDTDPEFADVLAWRGSLLNSGVKQSSIKQYLVELKAFFNATSDPELGAARFYEANPVARQLIPKTSKSDARPYDMILEDADVMKLLDPNSRRHAPEKTAARNYAIVVLLLTTCIRNSELIALTPDDIDWENSELTVESGKGNKYRTVPLNSLALAALKSYLTAEIRPTNEGGASPLFGNHGDPTGSRGEKNVSWKPFTSQGLSTMVERYVRSVTGVANVRTHDLRHVGSRIKLNSGTGIEELQQELGHNSVVTTQLYSGRLMARRKRLQTEELVAEMDRRAEQIENNLPEMPNSEAAVFAAAG